MNTIDIEKKILHHVGQAIGDFDLINDGDRILVALSGGKDSWALLNSLELLRLKAPVRFEIVCAHIDHRYGETDLTTMINFLKANNFTFHIKQFDIASIVAQKNNSNSPCGLCARLRRGALYGLAEKYNCNKIALGHHRDDFIETLLLNSFFVGRLAAMSVKFRADKYKSLIIRPLVYVPENLISQYVAQKNFPLISTKCPLNDEYKIQKEHKRKMIKNMLVQIEKKIPFIRQSLLQSIAHVKPSHLLDKNFWNF